MPIGSPASSTLAFVHRIGPVDARFPLTMVLKLMPVCDARRRAAIRDRDGWFSRIAQSRVVAPAAAVWRAVTYAEHGVQRTQSISVSSVSGAEASWQPLASGQLVFMRECGSAAGSMRTGMREITQR